MGEASACGLVEGGRRGGRGARLGALGRALGGGGSIGTGRSFAQVERYSAEVADFVTRSVGSGVEELVFVGWVTPLVALAGLVAIRSRRGLATLLGLAALLPCLFALGVNVPGYETCGGGSRGSTPHACPSASCRSRVSRWAPSPRSPSSA